MEEVGKRKKAREGKAWYEKNKKQASEWARQYYLDNREQKLELAKKYREENPEKVSFYRKRYYAENRAKAKAAAKNDRHRRRAAVASGVSNKELADWIDGQQKVCYWCGVKCADKYHLDHYHPISKGGKHELDNLVIACEPCNLRKNAKDPIVFANEMGRLFEIRCRKMQNKQNWGWSVLTKNQKARIRANIEGYTYQQWADRLGVGYYAVWRAASGNRRKYYQPKARKLSPKAVRDIRINRYGLSQSALAEKYGVSRTVIQQCYWRVTYKDVA